MAATETTRRSTHSTTSRRQLDRRGRHTAAPVVESQAEVLAPVTRAIHITPNVVIAARGAIRSRGERGSRRTHQSSALDLRRFRA